MSQNQPTALKIGKSGDVTFAQLARRRLIWGLVGLFPPLPVRSVPSIVCNDINSLPFPRRVELIRDCYHALLPAGTLEIPEPDDSESLCLYIEQCGFIVRERSANRIKAVKGMSCRRFSAGD